MSKGHADRTRDRKAYDRNHDAIKWPSKGNSEGITYKEPDLLRCTCGARAFIWASRYSNHSLTFVGTCENWNVQDDTVCPDPPDLAWCCSREQAAKEWNDCIEKAKKKGKATK